MLNDATERVELIDRRHELRSEARRVPASSSEVKEQLDRLVRAWGGFESSESMLSNKRMISLPETSSFLPTRYASIDRSTRLTGVRSWSSASVSSERDSSESKGRGSDRRLVTAIAISN